MNYYKTSLVNAVFQSVKHSATNSTVILAALVLATGAVIGMGV